MLRISLVTRPAAHHRSVRPYRYPRNRQNRFRWGWSRLSWWVRSRRWWRWGRFKCHGRLAFIGWLDLDVFDVFTGLAAELPLELLRVERAGDDHFIVLFVENLALDFSRSQKENPINISSSIN
eukprot:TRINITY_DN33415_c0_g1_i1.p1 TRINITY_DN33415_c0_g1~~TRINITY_DN33415_c0_g1_i1.p1  ORF type:complete len:123 (+),score=7.06 TRINITY_DN33415_c0_g1_i1:295-663(+)